MHDRVAPLRLHFVEQAFQLRLIATAIARDMNERAALRRQLRPSRMHGEIQRPIDSDRECVFGFDSFDSATSSVDKQTGVIRGHDTRRSCRAPWVVHREQHGFQQGVSLSYRRAAASDMEFVSRLGVDFQSADLDAAHGAHRD